MRLIAPTSSLHASWLEARDEWSDAEFMHGASIRTAAEYDVESRDGFNAWVESLLLQADPAHERATDRTPATNLWIVEDTDSDSGSGARDGDTRATAAGLCYLGALQLRHSLTEFTEKCTGHIGYGVRPSARRRGVAAFALRESQTYARRLGLPRVMLTCDEPNVASARTIESCGGVLQDTLDVDETLQARGFDARLRRYWIDL